MKPAITSPEISILEKVGPLRVMWTKSPINLDWEDIVEEHAML
jgi:hypothetical protein